MSIFNLYDNDYLEDDKTVLKEEFAEYVPQVGNDFNKQGNYDIRIEQRDQFILPYKAYFYFKGELKKEKDTATALTDADDAAIVSNAIMQLYSRIEYQINGNEIEGIQDPGQTTQMMGLLTYDAVNEDSGWSMGFGNMSFEDRKLYKKFSFAIPLSHIFGFCEDYRKVIYGAVHNFRFHKKAYSYDSIHTTVKPDTATVDNSGEEERKLKIDLTNVSLFMPIITPSLEVEKTFFEMLSNDPEPFDIMYRERRAQRYELVKGLSSFSWSLQETANRPRYVILAFQKQDNQDNTSKDLSVFEPTDIKKIDVLLGHRRYPEQDLLIDFENNDYSRIHKSAIDFKKQYSNLYNQLENGYLTTKLFKTKYPIFVVDISKHEDRTGNNAIDILIRGQFKNPLSENLIVFAVVISDKKIVAVPTASRMNIMV